MGVAAGAGREPDRHDQPAVGSSWMPWPGPVASTFQSYSGRKASNVGGDLDRRGEGHAVVVAAHVEAARSIPGRTGSAPRRSRSAMATGLLYVTSSGSGELLRQGDGVLRRSGRGTSAIFCRGAPGLAAVGAAAQQDVDRAPVAACRSCGPRSTPAPCPSRSRRCRGCGTARSRPVPASNRSSFVEERLGGPGMPPGQGDEREEDHHGGASLSHGRSPVMIGSRTWRSKMTQGASEVKRVRGSLPPVMPPGHHSPKPTPRQAPRVPRASPAARSPAPDRRPRVGPVAEQVFLDGRHAHAAVRNVRGELAGTVLDLRILLPAGVEPCEETARLVRRRVAEVEAAVDPARSHQGRVEPLRVVRRQEQDPSLPRADAVQGIEQAAEGHPRLLARDAPRPEAQSTSSMSRAVPSGRASTNSRRMSSVISLAFRLSTATESRNSPAAATTSVVFPLPGGPWSKYPRR